MIRYRLAAALRRLARRVDPLKLPGWGDVQVEVRLDSDLIRQSLEQYRGRGI